MTHRVAALNKLLVLRHVETLLFAAPFAQNIATRSLHLFRCAWRDRLRGVSVVVESVIQSTSNHAYTTDRFGSRVRSWPEADTGVHHFPRFPIMMFAADDRRFRSLGEIQMEARAVHFCL